MLWCNWLHTSLSPCLEEMVLFEWSARRSSSTFLKSYISIMSTFISHMYHAAVLMYSFGLVVVHVERDREICLICTC